MPVITRSGSKVNISAPPPVLRQISTVLKTPVRVGNKYHPSSVSVPAKKLPLIRRIIGGE